jgi:hypothetical protein
VSARLPGFAAEAALRPSRTIYRGTVLRRPAGTGASVALISRAPTSGCGCGLKECCCTFVLGGTIVYSCCPRDGSGPCHSGTLPVPTRSFALA